MRKETDDNKLDRAKEQGQAQYESILELVAPLNDDDADHDSARTAILEDALSVQVRAGWHEPGQESKPEVFEILLCTGGPAVRLVGTLDQHGEPESVTMQVQDWFQRWTHFDPAMRNGDEDVSLAYARCFWFGE